MDLATWNNGVIAFVWDRLPLGDIEPPVNGVPCLAEDWFVKDALAAGSPFVWRKLTPAESHRHLFRYARQENNRRLEKEGKYVREPERLLLHQMVAFLPCVMLAAEQTFAAQREGSQQ